MVSVRAPTADPRGLDELCCGVLSGCGCPAAAGIKALERVDFEAIRVTFGCQLAAEAAPR